MTINTDKACYTLRYAEPNSPRLLVTKMSDHPREGENKMIIGRPYLVEMAEAKIGSPMYMYFEDVISKTTRVQTVVGNL